MAETRSSITAFNRGEIANYLTRRIDNDVYQFAIDIGENVMALATGPLQVRHGFHQVFTLPLGVDRTQVRLRSHRFKQDQDYLMTFHHGRVDILKDNALADSLNTSYAGSVIRQLRFHSIKDTTILCHPNFDPIQLVRQGLDDQWKIELVPFKKPAFAKYNYGQDIRGSATTGGITLTLNGTTGYFNAGHAANPIRMRIGKKQVTLGAGAPSDATGGTALSSAGTAANAFDGDPGTNTAAGASGWVGYRFASDTIIKMVGININTTGTYTLVFESDNNDAFSSPTVIRTVQASLTAGTNQWFTMPAYTPETHFRVRCTNTSTGNFTIRELLPNKGLRIFATVNETLAASSVTPNFTSDWTEEGWGEHVGFPRVACRFKNRLVLGAPETQPDVVFYRVDNDLFNFSPDDNNDGTVVDTDGFTGRIVSEKSQFILNMTANRQGILALCRDGEFFLGSSEGVISPSKPPSADQQSDIGGADLPFTQNEGAIISIAANLKEVLAADYNFDTDRYVSESLTAFATHLFDDNLHPVGLAMFRGYKDHQSAYIFVPRSDGTMTVCTYNPRRKVLAWTRWTSPNARFRDVEVVYTTVAGVAIPTLYAVVERQIGETTRTFVERLMIEDVCLDGCLSAFDPAGSAVWTGLTQYAGQTIRVYGGNTEGRVDAVIRRNVVVSETGEITLPFAIKQIYAGIPFQARIQTLPPLIQGRGAAVRGNNVTFKAVTLDVENAVDVLTVNGVPMAFMEFGSTRFNAPLTPFTGSVRELIDNIDFDRRNPALLITYTGPIPMTLKAVHSELIVEI